MTGERAVQDAAVALVAHHVDPAQLARLIASRPGPTAAVAAAALARQGRSALPALHGLVCSTDARQAVVGAELLGQLAAPDTAALLRPLLDAADPDTVRAAAWALGRMRDAPSVPRLIALLDGEPRTWLAAIEALGAIGDVASVHALARWIDEPSLTVPVARALGRIGDPAALPTLLGVLIAGPATGARIAAMVAISEILRDRSVPQGELSRLRSALDRADVLPSFFADVLDSLDREVGRAAARLVIAAGLSRWLAHVLRRADRRDDLGWTARECARWPQRVVGGVAIVLDSRDPELRRALLICAPVTGAQAERLGAIALVALDDSDQRTRIAACVALGRLRVRAAAGRLAARLCGGSPLDQTAAAEALVELGAEVVDELERCLDRDAGSAALVLALRVLAVVGVGRFAGHVARLLDDGRSRVRVAALQAIVAADLPDAAAHVRAALDDAEHDVARVAIELLVERAERSAVPDLLRLARRCPTLRPFVLPALGRLGDDDTAAALLAELDDPAVPDRLAVAAAITAIDGPGAVAATRGWLAGDQPALRRLAAEAVARRVGAADLPLVAEMAIDHDATVRYQAAWALGRLDRDLAAPLLDEMLRDLDDAVANLARAGCHGRGLPNPRRNL